VPLAPSAVPVCLSVSRVLPGICCELHLYTSLRPGRSCEPFSILLSVRRCSHPPRVTSSFRLALRTESRHPPPAGLAPCANGLRRAAAAARQQPSMAPKGKKAPAAPPPPPSDWIPESTSKEFMDCNEAVVTHLRAGRADSCRGKPLLCNGRFRVTYEITHSSSPVAQGMLLGVCDATAWSTGDEKGNCEAALQRRSSTSLRSTATHKEYSRARMLHLVCCRSHAPPAQTWMRSK
jgi:hypothetical protein